MRISYTKVSSPRNFEGEEMAWTCSCGLDHEEEACGLSTDTGDPIGSALLSAVFDTPQRRSFLKWLGAPVALSIMSDLLPINSLRAHAAEPQAAEVSDLNVGFVPIICAAPLVIADTVGLYKAAGVKVSLVKTPGWDVARQHLESGEVHASQLLVPLPLAMNAGVGGPVTKSRVALIQNTNGQTIVLANAHKGRQGVVDWKGMRIAVPHVMSMHNLLLRHLIADAGLVPGTDVAIVAVPPPQMVARLAAGEIDGFMAPDPAGQMAVVKNVGFIAKLSSEIWNGHPCCGFTVPEKLIAEAPNAYLRLIKAVAEASAQLADPMARELVAKALARPEYLDVDPAVTSAVLIGPFNDGLGNFRSVPDRVAFKPYPSSGIGVWILTQLRRWGYLTSDPDYHGLAEQVFRSGEAKKFLATQGISVADDEAGARTILGRKFNPMDPEGYLKSLTKS